MFFLRFQLRIFFVCLFSKVFLELFLHHNLFNFFQLWSASPFPLYMTINTKHKMLPHHLTEFSLFCLFSSVNTLHTKTYRFQAARSWQADNRKLWATILDKQLIFSSSFIWSLISLHQPLSDTTGKWLIPLVGHDYACWWFVSLSPSLLLKTDQHLGAVQPKSF